MVLTLPPPGPTYSRENEAQARAGMERADGKSQKKDEDYYIATRLVLEAPNGSLWSVTVSNTGVLGTVAL